MIGHISCIIVEDQRPAQEVLEQYIRQTKQLNLVATCGNAVEASAVLDKDISLMFLDLHLPQVQGFEFLRSLPKPPLVIVTTASPDHALEGFDLNVIDYLLKPFSLERFLQAITKAQSALVGDEPTLQRKDALSHENIFLKVDGDIRRVACKDIDFIKAEGNFVEIFADQGKLFTHQTLLQMERMLPTDAFLRVHKSYIVRMDAIEKITSAEIFVAGTAIPIGRSYKDALLKRVSWKG